MKMRNACKGVRNDYARRSEDYLINLLSRREEKRRYNENDIFVSQKSVRVSKSEPWRAHIIWDKNAKMKVKICNK